MRDATRRHLVLAGASLAVLAAAGCSRGDQKGGAAAAGDMSLGDANAPVKVVEYASLTCPHCATFHEQVFPQFKAKYIDTGKVHYTFKEFLTAPANIAAAGFLLARCAGKERYFEVIDAVFRSQAEWQTSSPRDSLQRIAQSMGMNDDQFEACVTDRAARDALNARVEEGARKDEIAATPTFFINGKKAKEGAMTLEELDAAIAAVSP
jgi:protein-disulfide isomerase